MFAYSKSSGKHLICDFKDIQNTKLLNDMEELKNLCRTICNINDYDILGELDKSFQPIGSTFIFLLGESHLSVHTFPEKKYIAFDLFTCRQYNDSYVYQNIYYFLKDKLQAGDNSEKKIIDRLF
jgi:S-adenosylmethionine decarboxylase proenzyme